MDDSMNYRFGRLMGQGRFSVREYVSIALVMAVTVMTMFSTRAIATSATESSVCTGYDARSLPGGTAVSRDSTGALQAGAGTSIYLDIANVSASYPHTLKMVAIGRDTYLISSCHLNAPESSSFQVVAVDKASPNVGKVVSSATMPGSVPIKNIAALSVSTGLFVGICETGFTTRDTDYVVAGSVDPVTHAISPLTSSEHYGLTKAIAPKITRLSDNEFAIAYFAQKPEKLMTRYGYVDPVTQAITLSEPVAFHANPTSSNFFNLMGLTSSTYVLMHSGSDRSQNTGPIQAICATVSAGVVSLSKVTGAGRAHPMPWRLLDAARVSDTNAVVVFAGSSRFDLYAQLIHAKNGLIEFGSWLLLRKRFNANVKTLSGWMTDLRVAMTSDDGHFLVLFCDYFNNYSLIGIPGRIIEFQRLEATLPPFQLSQGEADSKKHVHSGSASIAVISSKPHANRAAIIFALNSGNTHVGNIYRLKFAVMETLPDVYGVTALNNQDETCTDGAVGVVTGGVQSGWANKFDRAPLTTDAVYFTNTLGTIMKSSSLYSEEGDDRSKVSYYFDAASNTLVSAAGRVGFAVSPDSLGIGSDHMQPVRTSVHRDIMQIDITCPQYLNMIALGSDLYLVSSVDVKHKSTTLQVVMIGNDSPHAGKVVSSVTVRHTISNMVTLSIDTGLFVGVCMDVQDGAARAYAVAGVVDPVTHTISPLRLSVDPYSTDYFTGPKIIRLSDTIFAIAYYKGEGPGQKLMTRIGGVSSRQRISFSDETTFSEDPQLSHTFDLVSLTPSTYALFFFKGTRTVSGLDGAGPLQVVLATANRLVQLSEITTFPGSDAMPVFSLASARVSDTSAVVVFADYNQNFGISALVIHVENGRIVFGSSLLLAKGPSARLIGNRMMDLDVAVTSVDGKFLVLYSDVSNNYAMTAIPAQINAFDRIERTSQAFLLNPDDISTSKSTPTSTTTARQMQQEQKQEQKQEQDQFAWGAIAVSSSRVQTSRAAILYSVTNSECTVKAKLNFAIMESLPDFS